MKMAAAEKVEIEEAKAKNKDKEVEYRLKDLSMQADGASAKKISEATG